MFSREQQILIDMSPDSDDTTTINGRIVARDWRGWVVSADASCQNVRRCPTLPDALAAVQAEKSAPVPKPGPVDPTYRLAELFTQHGGPGASLDLHQLEGYALDPDGIGKPAVYRVARARGAVHAFTWRGISGTAPTLAEKDAWHHSDEDNAEKRRRAAAGPCQCGDCP
jgi:hypothetical protein